MENIDEFKVSIMKKFEEMLDAGLVSLQDSGKFSSSEIGKEIGKFINQELKKVRKSHSNGVEAKKSDVKAPRKKQKKDDEEEKAEKKKRAPSAWNIYMKIKMAQLKAENEENGIKKSPKEMMADIAVLWKDEKTDFKIPTGEEAEE